MSKHPRVSTWDMSEHAWVRNLVGELLTAGLITSDRREEYPWLRYDLTDAGREALQKEQP